ncbi:hypothetical protein J7J35_05260 [Candidatus Bipolaricaulota bacterium]|nr:hypothetical protein [Candidatus Bipolaricaulota bacterium]
MSWSLLAGADFSTYYFAVGAGLGVGDLSIDAAYIITPPVASHFTCDV